jgi:hypothetical protein
MTLTPNQIDQVNIPLGTADDCISEAQGSILVALDRLGAGPPPAKPSEYSAKEVLERQYDALQLVRISLAMVCDELNYEGVDRAKAQ